MLPNEEKRKSLFQLFQKSAPSKAEPQFITEAAIANADAPVAQEPDSPASYGYVASWQKAADNEQEEAQREVVVNAAGMSSRLDEIFKAPSTPNEAQENSEPRCLSATAAERFSAALRPQTQVVATPVVQVTPEGPAVVTGIRFSDRLKQHVENSLQQSLVAAPVAVGETK